MFSSQIIYSPFTLKKEVAEIDHEYDDSRCYEDPK